MDNEKDVDNGSSLRQGLEKKIAQLEKDLLSCEKERDNLESERMRLLDDASMRVQRWHEATKGYQQARDRESMAYQQSQESLGNLQEILDSVYDGVFIHDMDGSIIDVNRKVLKMYGVSKKEALEYTIAEDYSAEENPVEMLPSIWESVRKGKPQFFEWKARRPKDGTVFDVDVYLKRIEFSDRDVILANVRDTTERRKAEDEIVTLSRVVEQSPASVIITDPEGLIEYVNPKFTEVSGYTLDELKGLTPRVLKSGKQSREFYDEMWSTIASGGSWQGEFCNRAKDGREYWELASIIAVTGSSGQVLHYVAVKEDITERKRQEDRIRLLALHDTLTGLPNRDLLMDRLSQAIARCKRTNTRAAVVFMDLDGFKVVNDTAGHLAGDMVLKEVARRLGKATREVDTLARLGGDEFVVVLQDVEDREDILQAVRRILDEMIRPFPAMDQQFKLGASMGVSLCPDHGMDVDSLITCADKAMYRVKHGAKNDVFFYGDHPEDEAGGCSQPYPGE